MARAPALPWPPFPGGGIERDRVSSCDSVNRILCEGGVLPVSPDSLCTPALPTPPALSPSRFPFCYQDGKGSVGSSPLNRSPYFFSFYLGLHPWCMEVPRLGVESELHLPAYTTATANVGSEPSLRPTSQLMATANLRPTERGQGSNLYPHEY